MTYGASVCAIDQSGNLDRRASLDIVHLVVDIHAAVGPAPRRSAVATDLPASILGEGLVEVWPTLLSPQCAAKLLTAAFPNESLE